MNSSVRLSRVVLTLLLATALSSICAGQTYTVTDLGTLHGGTVSGAKAVNATGEITGYAYNSNDAGSDVFLYSGGTMTDMGTLGGKWAVGNGVNGSGQVAGYSTIASGGYHAFVSNGGKLTDLGDLGGGSAVAYAINDAGQVVGSAVTAQGSNHPFLYSSGKMTDLGTLGSPDGNNWWNTAQGVNKQGVVVGTSYDAQGNFFGFMWRNGTMIKMGTLGGAWSQAYAVNNKNQVTGVAYTRNGSAHAFLATNGVLRDLGTISDPTSTTWGFGLNDAGIVVGQSTFQSTYHAFVYSGGVMKDLNKLIPARSGWVLLTANDINNAGQIVGEGLHNGKQHGFLLTPQ
jgi:probable HAF family extracellular repeat protein